MQQARQFIKLPKLELLLSWSLLIIYRQEKITYDITPFLREGENVAGVILGNGWYNHQSTAVWYFDKAPWRVRPKFCLDLQISHTDGTQVSVNSGNEWKTSTGPVIFNSIYTAEHYDARKEMPGWNRSGFDDSSWKNVLLTGAPSGNIVSQAMHPIRNVEEIYPVKMIQQGPRTWLFDFGRNIAGVCKMKISGTEGTEIRLIHEERLDKNGRVDQCNINVHYRPTDDTDPFQTDIFILSGKQEDSFMPSFNYKGFQYVEVSSDKPLSLNRESLTAFFMHSDVPAAGKINSSNPTLNKIWQATNASYLSNLFGYPTDCPQREKNGWTGDAHINIETGFKNILLRPNFVAGLQKFEAENESPYGKIVSSLEKLNNSIRYHVSIPGNSTATLFLKAGRISLNGKEFTKSKDIQAVNRNDGSVSLFLKSGNYEFKLVQ